MKRFIVLSFSTYLFGMTFVSHLDARGPGGGGGGFRGGGGGFSGGGLGGGISRPSPSVGRSPSLGSGFSNGASSRPSLDSGLGSRFGAGDGIRPNAGSGLDGIRPGGVGDGVRPGIAPGDRPTAGQLDNFLNIPRPGVGGELPRGGGAAAEFLREGGGARLGEGSVAERFGLGQGEGLGSRGGLDDRSDRQDNRQGNRDSRQDNRQGDQGDRQDNRQDRRQNFTDNRPDRIENRQQYQQDRQQRRDQVRDQVRDNYPRLDFWADHPNWAAWRINAPYRWATWGALSGWLGYGAAEPVSYSYGENVYYQDNSVYSGDQPVASQDEYTQQAETIAESAPEVDPSQADWMPLGVFALTQDGQASGSTPTLFLQLAISKEGVLSGNLNNKLTGETQTIEGMADKQSQRAAWNIKDRKWPIMETGLGNLTKDTAAALVHFADGTTQQWLMVHLQDQQSGDSQ